MRVPAVWLIPVLSIAGVVAGCQDSGRHSPTFPQVAQAEVRLDATAPPTAPPTARDVLAKRRAATIARLHAYREAAVFPADRGGFPLAVFRDDKGIRCPMSELIYKSGHADLVDAVVRLDNSLRLADVHGGPLLDWMLQSGLTQEEIVTIQGAMEMDYMRRPIELTGQQFVVVSPNETVIADARAQVVARLVAAERMLQAGTAASLDLAAERLGDRKRQIAEATRAPAPPAGGPTQLAAAAH